MRRLILFGFLGIAVAAWSQTPSSNPNSSESSAPAAKQSSPAKTPAPNLEPPRADRVNAESLETGESSSKDDEIDLSPPREDLKDHPSDSGSVNRAENPLKDAGTNDVGEFHPWDPHKAAKDVEVGDFYFKRQNYRAAESRYREALYYKDNDALATYRLAVCLDKMKRPDEAVQEYESYLRILPHGPESEPAKKAIDRIKAESTKAASGK